MTGQTKKPYFNPCNVNVRKSNQTIQNTIKEIKPNTVIREIKPNDKHNQENRTR